MDHSWGITVLNGLYHAMGWACECGWSAYGKRPREIGPCIVGFNTEALKQDSSLIVGVAILECPECHNRFYFHIDHGLVRFWSRYCPDWPKDEQEESS